MRTLERMAVGLALSLLVLGLSVVALTTPGLTRMLVIWSDAPALSGLTAEQATQAAEDVRRYVTGADTSPLPEMIDGRPAFDEEAVSHLDDVAGVMSSSRSLVAICAGFVATWVALALARRRRKALADGLLSGGVATLLVVGVAILVGIFDFGVLFARFHGLLFEPGTWQFAADALLIQLFPQQFWVAMAALWGLLSAIGAGALLVASRTLRSGRERELSN